MTENLLKKGTNMMNRLTSISGNIDVKNNTINLDFTNN
jgi:hypothetical protein